MCKNVVYVPPETNMTMEKQHCEDVSPTKNGDFPAIAKLVNPGGGNSRWFENLLRTCYWVRNPVLGGSSQWM